MTLARVVSGTRATISSRLNTFLTDVNRVIADDGAVTPAIDWSLRLRSYRPKTACKLVPRIRLGVSVRRRSSSQRSIPGLPATQAPGPPGAHRWYTLTSTCPHLFGSNVSALMITPRGSVCGGHDSRPPERAGPAAHSSMDALDIFPACLRLAHEMLGQLNGT